MRDLTKRVFRDRAFFRASYFALHDSLRSTGPTRRNKTIAKRDRSITSSVIEQRIAEGRGKGTGADYNPGLHVQDVPTEGRAWRIKGWKTGRDHHLFCDLERDYFLIAHWSPKIIDIREQFPFPLETTLEIAKKVGIRHPTDLCWLLSISVPKMSANCGSTNSFSLLSTHQLDDVKVSFLILEPIC
jgi:hypothetical protein